MTTGTVLGFLPTFGLIELIFVLFALTLLAVPVWGIIDAAQRPDGQWQSIGASRTTWIVLMAVFGFLCAPVGLVIATYYLVSLRPRLNGVGAKRSGGTMDRDF